MGKPGRPAKINVGPCKEEGCNRKSRNRGYCDACYARKMRNGELQRLSGKNMGPCAVKYCDRPAMKRGYCNKCYNRKRLDGELPPIRPYKRTDLRHIPGAPYADTGQGSLAPANFAPGIEAALTLDEPARTELLLSLRIPVKHGLRPGR